MKKLNKEREVLINNLKQATSALSQMEGQSKTVKSIHDSIKKINAMEAIGEAAKLEGCANIDLLIECISEGMNFDDFDISIDFTEITKEEVRRAKVDPDTCVLFHPKKSTTSPTTPKRKNPFSKKDFNLTEQAQLMKSNPELARRLKAEAEEEI